MKSSIISQPFSPVKKSEKIAQVNRFVDKLKKAQPGAPFTSLIDEARRLAKEEDEKFEAEFNARLEARKERAA